MADANNLANTTTDEEFNVRPRKTPWPNKDEVFSEYRGYSRFFRSLYSSSSSGESSGKSENNADIIAGILASVGIDNGLPNDNDGTPNYPQPEFLRISNRDNDSPNSPVTSDVRIHQEAELPALSISGNLISQVDPGGTVTYDDLVVDNCDSILRQTIYPVEGKHHYTMGIELAIAGKYLDAIKEWKIASAFGFTKANYRLGICHERGLGISANPKKVIIFGIFF